MDFGCTGANGVDFAGVAVAGSLVTVGFMGVAPLSCNNPPKVVSTEFDGATSTVAATAGILSGSLDIVLVSGVPLRLGNPGMTQRDIAKSKAKSKAKGKKDKKDKKPKKNNGNNGNGNNGNNGNNGGGNNGNGNNGNNGNNGGGNNGNGNNP